MEGRTYKVIRNSRKGVAAGKGTDTVEASGLSWEDARALRDKLAEAERAAFPHLTSWTSDVFYCELEVANA